MSIIRMESMDLGSSPLPGGWLGWRNFDDLVLLGGGRRALLQAARETKGLIGYPHSLVFASASLSARPWRQPIRHAFSTYL